MSPLRVALGQTVGHDQLDGGWWPRSRVFATEFADLVDHFPRGRIVRAIYSPPDWDDAPRRVKARAGRVKVGMFPRDDTHVIYVTTSDRVTYRLLVVPSSFDDAQGEEAMLAAATPGNRHPAGELLDVVTNEMPVDPSGQWASEGTP